MAPDIADGNFNAGMKMFRSDKVSLFGPPRKDQSTAPRRAAHLKHTNTPRAPFFRARGCAQHFLHPRKWRTRAPVLTGGPGAAPGGVASKNRWVYMRVRGESISYSREYLSVHVSVCCYKTAAGVENGLRERLCVCRGGSRNQLRGLKEGGSARRGAMLCLPADLTSHAISTFQLLTL